MTQQCASCRLSSISSIAQTSALSQQEIDDCYAQLSDRDIADIRFAQEQVRNFAQHQRDSLKDIEVETLPGVILGHKKIFRSARRAATCRAGNTRCWRRRICRLSPRKSQVCRALSPVRRRLTVKPAPAIVVAQHMAGADEIYCPGVFRPWRRWPSVPRASHRWICWWGRATPLSLKPNVSCLAASVSICSPGRRRPRSLPMKAWMVKSAPLTC